MNLRGINYLDPKKEIGKKALLRVDINSVFMDGRISESPRFAAAAETIKSLMNKKLKIIILAHQGRPEKNDFCSLEEHARILSKYVNRSINYVNDVFGAKAKERILSLNDGAALMLRNIRDYKDELHPKNKSNKFKDFCMIFDYYINDAFSVSHRNHGSIVLPPRYLKSFMGLNFERELKTLEKFKYNSNKNIIFILGGAKIDDYLCLIDKIKYKNIKLVCGGVLGNLFLIASGINFGYENKWAEEQGYGRVIKKLKKIYNNCKKRIILPCDFAVDYKVRKEISLNDIPINKKIWDIGYRTVNLFNKEIETGDIIFMKGPLGYSEIPSFSFGTKEVLKHISKLTKNKSVFSLLGGGHLTTTMQKYKIPDNFSYISLSGGALLRYLAGEKLPGIEALKKSRIKS